jgi:ABC-2 type transport system permease protein
MGGQIGALACPRRCSPAASRPARACPPSCRPIMLAAPTTHFVKFAQAILCQGAGLDVVWPQFLARPAAEKVEGR